MLNTKTVKLNRKKKKKKRKVHEEIDFDDQKPPPPRAPANNNRSPKRQDGRGENKKTVDHGRVEDKVKVQKNIKKQKKKNKKPKKLKESGKDKEETDAESNTANSQNSKFAKYQKMIQIGIPEGAVVVAMTRDGVTPPPGFFGYYQSANDPKPIKKGKNEKTNNIGNDQKPKKGKKKKKRKERKDKKHSPVPQAGQISAQEQSQLPVKKANAFTKKATAAGPITQLELELDRLNITPGQKPDQSLSWFSAIYKRKEDLEDHEYSDDDDSEYY